MNTSILRHAALLLTCAFAVPLVQAEDAVLLRGENDGVVINESDILADALRAPEEVRGPLLAKPENVSQLATSLYVRRVFAAEAENSGLARRPDIVAQLRLARERILSDARMAEIDRAIQPDSAAVEAYARSVYKANPERFKSGERVHARHILIRGSDEAARAIAERVLSAAQLPGADFAALAEEYSEDLATSSTGGDLGVFGRGRMVPPFEIAVFALDVPGVVPDLVQTQFGLHIVRVDEKLPAGQRSFDEVRGELVKEAEAALLQKERKAHSDRIMAAARPDSAAIEAFSAQHGGAGKDGGAQGGEKKIKPLPVDKR